MWKSDFIFEPAVESEVENEIDSEIVMKEIQKLYLVREVGLKDAAKSLNDSSFKVTMPRQKISVLLVGHHNEAKRKFLDIYFNEERQSEYISRVNYDKLDRIYITHGRQRKWLSGESVLEYCPHLAQLKNVPGLKDYLTTEISTRKTKSLVSFILAPDSVREEQVEIEELDPNNNVTRRRPLDINKAIATLAEASDIIFIFFDPTGKIPPSSTLAPFQSLWEDHHEKLHLLLAKVSPDECSEQTRENTLSDIVRDVWRNPDIRNLGFLPQIYCPDLSMNVRVDERLWNVIQEATDKSVEKALNQLEKDANRLKDRLVAQMEKNMKAKEKTTTPSSVYLWFIVFTFLVASIWIIQIDELISSVAIVIGLGLIGVFFVVASLFFEREPTLLSQSQEDLLNRRIQFAHHALYEKDKMKRMYGMPDLCQQSSNE